MNVEQLLINEEGEKLVVYRDSLGYSTIGVGICVDPRVKGAGLRPEESAFILANRVQVVTAQVSSAYPWFNTLDSVRKAVVISMVWQCGILDSWTNFRHAMEAGDYQTAANEMLASKVAKEQAPTRWQRQSQMMRSGEWAQY